MNIHCARGLRGLVGTLVVGLVLGIGPGCDNDDGHDDSGFDFGLNDANLVICIGDSITENGYPAYLGGMISKIAVDHGVGGVPSAAAIGAAQAALAAHPGYLLILYGANDIIQGRPLEAIPENLRAVINMARANKTIPCLATLTPMIGIQIGHAAQVQVVNDMIRQLAETEDVRMADLFSEFGDQPEQYMLSDGLHPNAAGHQAVAASFADACF